MRSKRGDLTAGVMASSEENSSGGLAKADNMAGGRSGKDAVLTDKELLDTVGGANLGDQLDDLGVPVASIPPNHQERAYSSCSHQLQVFCVCAVSQG